MTSRAALTLILSCLFASPSHAQDSTRIPDKTLTDAAISDHPSPFTVTLYWENDGSILKRNDDEDRHYTNGSAIGLAHQPDWANRFADTATFGETFDRTAAGYILGQLIFTPENTVAHRLQRKDRPYAGYLFGGVYVQRTNGQTFDHAQLDIGIVGPSSLAESAQKTIHDWIDIDKPNGWDNQLKDELTAQLSLRRKWRLDLRSLTINNTQLAQQLIPQVELAAGSVYRHVAAGATWRIGHNLPDDFGPGRLADVADATGKPSDRWSAYGFIRAAGRAVEHNLFLEGNSYDNSHGVEAETLVGEVQVGIALAFRLEGWDVSGNYSQTFVSEQFEGQQGSDSFGALTLSARKRF
jgi:lipid A 3-O-deacylase